MLFEDFGPRHLSAVTLLLSIAVAWHDMDVQVKDSLPRRLTIELHQFDSVRIKCAAHPPGDVPYRLHQAGHEAVFEIKQVLCRCSRQYQGMAVGLRHDVQKGQAVVVLINGESLGFTTQDLRKNILIIVSYDRPLASCRIE